MSAPAILPILDRFLERANPVPPTATPAQRAFLRAQDRAAQALTADLSDELHALFEQMGERAVTAYEIAPSHLKEAIADPSDAALVAAILSAMGIDDWTLAELTPLLREHYFLTASRTYEIMDTSFELGVGTDLPDPIARRVIALGGRRAGLVDLSAQTRSALFQALAEGRAEGMGPVELARLIRQYVPAGRFTAMEAAKPGSGVRYRADMIARTETLHAQRISVAEAGQRAGFTRYLAFDNRTGFDDAECKARSGTEYDEAAMIAETNAEHPLGTLSWSPVPGSQKAA